MGDSQKSYYQVSFTGTQALIALLVILGALALSFFFGAKAGFSRSRAAERRAEAAGNAGATASPTGTSAPAPAPEPASSGSRLSGSGLSESGLSRSGLSRSGLSGSGLPGPAVSRSGSSEPAAGAGVPAGIAAKPEAPPASSASGPIVTQTFEDREAGLPEEKAPPSTEIASSESSLPRTPIGGPPKGGSKSSAGYFVQVLSTSSKAEAGRWKDKLSAKKYRAAVSPVDGKKGKLFRVRVGPYADKEQARKVAAKISGEEKRQAWVAPAE